MLLLLRMPVPAYLLLMLSPTAVGVLPVCMRTLGMLVLRLTAVTGVLMVGLALHGPAVIGTGRKGLAWMQSFGCSRLAVMGRRAVKGRIRWGLTGRVQGGMWPVAVMGAGSGPGLLMLLQGGCSLPAVLLHSGMRV